MTLVEVKPPLRKRFGQHVKDLRRATGLSQEAFADRCGFARSYLSRIERGAANPSLDAIGVLADALGVAPARLLQADGGDAHQGMVIVPFAADGTCFNPTLRRPHAKTYGVGEKSQTLRFESFEEALDHLKSMNPAKWWRPNSKGNWGLVTAVRWAPLPGKKQMATNFPKRHHSQ